MENLKLNSYKANNELGKFIKYTSVKNLIFFNNKKNQSSPNFINFDSNFCRKANLLKMNGERLFKYIKNVGINKGIFFHPKQLLNYNKNIKILEDEKKNLYVKEKNNIFNLANYCDHIYSKDLYSFLGEFNLVNIPSYYKNRKIAIILFWGNNKLGKEILEKINNFSFPFNLLIVIKDNLNYKFDDDIFVIKTKEYGNDIIPSLIGYNFLSQILDFNYIIKLQTKTSDKWRSALVDYFFDKSEKQLISMLNGKEYICADKYSRSISYHITPVNSFMGLVSLKNKVKFPAGSIYMTNKEKYEGIFAFMLKHGHTKYFLQNMYDNHSILTTKSPIHFLERLIGVNLNSLLNKIDSKPNPPTKLKKVIFKLDNEKNKDLDYRILGSKYLTQNEYKKVFQKLLESKLNEEKMTHTNIPFSRIKEIRDNILKSMNKKYIVTKSKIDNNSIHINLVKPKEENPKNKKVKRNCGNSKLLLALNKRKNMRKIKNPEVKVEEKVVIKDEIIEPEYSYYKNTSHCYGWAEIMRKIENIMKNDVLIIDNVENYFILKKLGVVKKSWVGFIHEPINVPLFLKKYYLDLDLLYNNDTFKKSLESCLGLISFSSNVSENILKNVENVNIYNLKHPITLPREILENKNINTEVNVEKIINKKQLLFLGQHHRRNYLMFEINGYKKLWLPGLREIKKKKLIIEKICKTKDIKVDWDLIKIEYNDKPEDYINRIKNNLVIISCYNSNANNAILDIIALGIPALVERNKSTEEYLGKNYPGLFNIESINKILNETDKLKLRLMDCKKYLFSKYETLSKKLSLELFVSCVDNIVNTRKLNHLYFVNNNILRTDSPEKKKVFNNIKTNKKIIDYYGGLDIEDSKLLNLSKKSETKNILINIDDKIVGRIRNKQIRMFESS